MKKIFVMMAAVAALGFTSCSNEVEEIAESSKELKFNISVSNPTGAVTKAVKTSWNEGDKIFIWFDSSIATDPELTIAYNGSTWEAGELASGVSEKLQAEGTMKYVYFSTNTWDTSNHADYGSFHIFKFPNSNVTDDDVAYCNTPLVLCSHIEGYVAPTYTFVDNTLSLSLDRWKFITNTQVTVPIPAGVNADNYRLTFRKTGYTSYTVTDVRLFDEYIGRGTSSSAYARGLTATDGAVFYLQANYHFYDQSGKITFTLVDMSSGSKNTYQYTTSSKVLPLSNGVTIDAVAGSDGCAENAFSAIKLPAFTGTADENWILQ